MMFSTWPSELGTTLRRDGKPRLPLPFISNESQPNMLLFRQDLRKIIISQQCVLHNVKLHLRDGRTGGRTGRRRESNLVHFSLKMWHLMAKIIMMFLIINTDQISYIYWLISDFFYLPLKFLWSIGVRPPHTMDAPDRHKGQRDKRTNGRTDEETRLFVRPSLRSLAPKTEFDNKGSVCVVWGLANFRTRWRNIFKLSFSPALAHFCGGCRQAHRSLFRGHFWQRLPRPAAGRRLHESAVLCDDRPGVGESVQPVSGHTVALSTRLHVQPETQ